MNIDTMTETSRGCIAFAVLLAHMGFIAPSCWLISQWRKRCPQDWMD